MDSKIGDRIRQRRKEMGFTLKELAGDRITPAQISAIENSKCKPSASLLEYLCKRLEVDADYFTLSNEQRLCHKFNEIRMKCKKLLDSNNAEQAKLEMDKTDGLFGSLDDEQKGYYYYVKGLAAYEAQDYSKAFDLYGKGVVHYIKTKDISMIADLYVKVGNALFYMGNSEMALGYYLNAYSFIDKKLDNDITIKIMFNLAVCYSELERYKNCKEYVDKCMDFLRCNKVLKKDAYLPGLEMLNGILLKEEKESAVSIQNFKDAFEKYKQENDMIGMGRAMFNLGMTCWEAGQNEEAADYLRQSIDMKNNAGEKNVVDSYVNLAKLYQEMDLLDKANEIIGIAEEKMMECDSKEGISEVFIAKFELMCKQEDYDRAEIFAYLALDTIQKSGLKKLESSMYIKLSEMYKKIGDEKSTIDNLMKANAITMKGEFEKLQNLSK